MSAIATKIVEKYNLTPKMSVSELSQYTSEFLKELTDDRKRNQARRRLRGGFKFSSDQRSGVNKTINLVESSCRITIASPPKDLEEEIIREITKRILQNRYRFSEYRVNALFSTQKNESKTINISLVTSSDIAIPNKPQKRIEEETIGDMAQRILRDKLSIRDVRAEAYALALSAKNTNAGSSRLSRLRRELKNLGALPAVVEATKFPDITEEANYTCPNKIQMDNLKKAKTIDYPDEFTLESVKERLDAYDINTPPNYQALADVMLMLCICPAELITLHITDAGVTALSAKNTNAGSSRLSRLRRELKNLGALPAVVEATKFPDITEEANYTCPNKIQMDNLKKAKTIDYPDEFTLESVKERLDAYDINTPPNYQALADVMLMLCICPAELITLHITDAGVTGYAKNRGQPDIPQKFRSMEKDQKRARELLTWIQCAISSGRMEDLGKPGAKWFNRFLKDFDLIPKHLRKIGAVYVVVTNEAKHMADAYTIAGEALRKTLIISPLQFKITL
ncbi:hypothetical protein Glove_426g31 [Diversispora epigaea]|uniref:Uncharacterized protein n=1 Tax=Diversispora epigaea TaxID=1348612 RepID=A0A397GYT6_9GLOM|nr:hypothetical protein Glove_426g31 [Diversispora epigaea]